MLQFLLLKAKSESVSSLIIRDLPLAAVGEAYCGSFYLAVPKFSIIKCIINR